MTRIALSSVQPPDQALLALCVHLGLIFKHIAPVAVITRFGKDIFVGVAVGGDQSHDDGTNGSGHRDDKNKP
jgi:hypothetical protein